MTSCNKEVTMLEFYKTFENKTVKIDQPEYGCWINAVSPTEEEKNFLIEEMGIVPEFVKSSLDEEESSHLDYDEDNNQTLVIVDYPSAEDKADGFDTLQYTTLPLGIVIMKGYIVTISLYENYNIDDMAKGKVRGIDTNLKTRFLLLLLLRISQRYLIYLRQIDRLSSRTEHRLHKSMQNKELIQMLGLEKSLVYFSTSLKTDEITLNKIMRGKPIKLYDEDQELLDDVMIEIHQAIEMCNIYSNILSGTMDAFASVISNNLNIVMKILTVITIVMSIPNIIFSFYGMNVTTPKSIMASGGKFGYPDDACETPDLLQTIYTFDGFTVLWDHAIGIDDGAYGRNHGLGFVGENGTLVVDRGGWEVIPEKVGGTPRMEAVPLKKAYGEGGLNLHVKNHLECIKTRNRCQHRDWCPYR